jgi:DNA polymerase-3 subunit alpha
MGLKVEPPAVNRSAFRFTVGGDGSVVYGIGAIKGVGEGAIEAMLAAREAEGPFADLWDFCRRIDLHKANRRVLEAMIRAGALDELGANRATLMAQLPLALKLAEQDKESAAAGQVDLFGALEPLRKSAPDPQIAGEVREDWEEEQRLDGERETLGLYLTGHPINRFERELGAVVSARIAPMLEAGKDRNDREPRTVAGLVVSVRHGKTQRGRMGSVVLDDRTGRIEVAVFNEVYEQVRDLLTPDRILVVTGALAYDEYRDNWSLRAERVRTLEDARAELASALELVLDLSGERAADAARITEALTATLDAYRGPGLAVLLDTVRPGARGRLRLGDGWRVQPSDELLKRLRQILGPDAVQVIYGGLALRARAPEPERERPRLALVR